MSYASRTKLLSAKIYESMVVGSGWPGALLKRTPNERQDSPSGVEVRLRRLIYALYISSISLWIGRSAAATKAAWVRTPLVIFMDTLEDVPISQHTSLSPRSLVWFSRPRNKQVSRDR